MSRSTGYIVVIPCLNEEGNIGRLVTTLQTQDSNCYVLVMDNMSTDNTRQEALDAGARVETLPGSVSDMVWLGVQRGRCDRIIVMDGDWSHDPTIVPKMAEELKIHDMVYGYRESSKDSLLNKGISFLGKLQSLLLGPGIKDRMTGFFGLRSSIIPRGRLGQGPKPFLEYVVKSRPTSMTGIPYEFKKREVGISKLGRSTILLPGIFQLFRLHLSKYYQFFKYVCVGGSGFLLFLGLLALFKEVLGLPYFSAAVISGSISFFYNFTFHKIWTFAFDDSISLRLLPNMLWNLGHDNDEGNFDWWEYTSGWPHKRFKRTLGKHIKDLAGEGERILSLGCGSSPILNLFSGQKVGVDMNPEKINFFKDHTDASLFVGDITKIGEEELGKEKFDIILCNEVIEHIEGEGFDHLLNLFDNYLNVGGRLVVSTPDTSSKLGNLVENVLHGEFHTNLMTADNLVEAIKAKGLVYTDNRNFLWDKIHLFEKVEYQIEEVTEGMFVNA